MESNYHFLLTFIGGSYKPTYYCKKCGIELLLMDYEEIDSNLYRVVSDKLIDWHCPKCGHDKIEQIGAIDFD